MTFPREVVVQYTCPRCGERDYGVAFTASSSPNGIPIRCVCGEPCFGEVCRPLPRKENPDGPHLRKS